MVFGTVEPMFTESLNVMYSVCQTIFYTHIVNTIMLCLPIFCQLNLSGGFSCIKLSITQFDCYFNLLCYLWLRIVVEMLYL